MSAKWKAGSDGGIPYVTFNVKDDFKRIKAYISATQAQIDGANLSALRSTANVVREALRGFVKKGGEGWKPLSTLTVLMRQRSREGRGGRYIRKAAGMTPYFWIRKFARYHVRGETAVIQFGGGYLGQRKGKTRRVMDPDAFIDEVVKRMEQGERIRVTDKMRKRIAALSGTGLRRDTHTIAVPKRPAISPVFRRVQSRIGPHYRDKFFAALQRYQGTGEKAMDSVVDTAAGWMS